MAFSNSRAFICNLSKNKNVFMTKNIIPNGLLAITTCQTFNKCLYATEEVLEVDSNSLSLGLEKKKMSKAMKIYLERAQEHNEFLNNARAEYKIGKRHLANMMGENPDDFSQEDVKKAISYLFPSGIYQPKALPIMDHPDNIFPPRKAAEFDESGRPFNSMFYTCRPNYFNLLHSIVSEMKKLDGKEDELYSRGVQPDPNLQLNLDNSVWLSKSSIEENLLEEISDEAYKYFINTMDRLVSHPVSYEAKDFIMKYRKMLKNVFDSIEKLPIQYESDGTPFVTVTDCMRKSTRGKVTLRGKGSGKIVINGEDIYYFKSLQCREQNTQKFCWNYVHIDEKSVTFE